MGAYDPTGVIGTGMFQWFYLQEKNTIWMGISIHVIKFVPKPNTKRFVHKLLQMRMRYVGLV